jgi:hypothetical protein
MDRFLLMGAVALVSAGCSAEDSTSDTETAMSDEAVIDQHAPIADVLEADEEMMAGRSIDGRWGVQYEACSPDNETGDGVILISQYDVIIGLDACSITGSSEEGDGFALQAMCDGAEGDQYAQTFYFSTPQDGVMRWDNRDLNRTEDYISCDGGAMH